MARDFLATVTPEVLAAPRKNPRDPGRPDTVRSCPHVILNEEWGHLRYAIRDLDAIQAERAGEAGGVAVTRTKLLTQARHDSADHTS